MRAEIQKCLVSGVFLVAVSSSTCAETSSERAKRLVQESLVAESKGLEDERRALLDAAQREDPSEPTLRWRLGQVQQGKAWKTVDSIASEQGNCQVLARYQQLRDASSPTFFSQLALAAYCEEKNLQEAAIAHRMAVLDIEPNHEYTRRKLGYLPMDGKWYLSQDLESLRIRNQRVQQAAIQESDRLQNVARKLLKRSLSVEEATDKLLERAGEDVIPAWERYVSSAHAQGALAVVSALATMRQPEATLALARHAIWVDDPQVRMVAMQALKGRDQYAYVPALLGELQEPWVIGSPGMFVEGNRIVYRYVAASERQDKRELKIFDNSFFLANNAPMAAQMANDTNLAAASQSELVRYAINSQIQQYNERISQALRVATDQWMIATPRDWWNWWDNHTEVYSDEEKQFVASYDSRSTFVSGPVISRLPLVSRPAAPSTSKERLKKDCLAPGTVVVTDRGPVAIENVRVGDSVWSKNLKTGEVLMQPVLRTTIREPGRLIRITLTNHRQEEAVVRTSGGHPFFVNGSGWVRARELQPGMALHGLDGTACVKSTEIEQDMTRTYNLVIYRSHSYFAGPMSVLSHDNSMVLPASAEVPGLQVMGSL